ncbi:NAD(P)-binding protein [Lophium mytilinum]|uniref:NAD(P)-binding protein n=1 Tax=Lophium mytilinum TaxID=390894 RepID=A0A6A6QDE8_9PEZI|nr:NAD(P)-binding protein [Lophium mytilinum]
MSSQEQRTVLVIGSGPGIGNHVGATFAAQGFNRVILLARNAERIKKDKKDVESKSGRSGISVETIQADISNKAALKDALNQVEKVGGNIECVFFNAARILPAEILSEPVDTIEEDVNTTIIALYQVAQWAIPRLEALAASSSSVKPSLLVTNSFLAADPLPFLFSLSLVKAAQRNLVISLAKTFESKGIRVGLVTVGGAVAPENKHLNPTYIAEKIWGFFDQGKGLEVEIVE